MLDRFFAICLKCKDLTIPCSPNQHRFLFLIAQLFYVVVRGSALLDTKKRSVEHARCLEICHRLEQQLCDKYDEMLWNLMNNAANKTHVSLEPMFSILDPNLPGFHPLEDDEESDHYELSSDGSYVKTPSKKELRDQQMINGNGVISKIMSWITTDIDEKRAKGGISDTNVTTLMYLLIDWLKHFGFCFRTFEGEGQGTGKAEEKFPSRE